MNHITLPSLHLSFRGIIRSTWFILLSFVLAPSGYAQQHLTTQAVMPNPMNLGAPANADNLLLPTSAYMDGTVSTSNYVSDYYYVFNYNSLPSACCSESITITAAKNSFQSGNNWWSFSTGGAYTGTYTRNIGPSVSELLYVTVYYDGKDNTICVFNCSSKCYSIRWYL
jgi:hypothetical protein